MSFPQFSAIRASAFAAVAAVSLSACTVAVEEPYPGGPGPQICTREYAPVCAQRGRDRETFQNACVARTQGYEPVYQGQCRRRPPQTPRPGPRDPDPRVCPQIYQPVCARKNNVVRTYGNDCMARADLARVLYPGQCRAR